MRRAVLLTGATGALGSTILPRLIDGGCQVVCLVRGRGGESAVERISRKINPTKVTVVQGDITHPRCGLSLDDEEFVQGRVNTILHCAASISFDSAEETRRANIEGVKNVLGLADALDITSLHHISTSYVAGDATRFEESDLYVGQQLRNPYEQSKLEGEKLVRAWGNNHDREVVVFRPSILVGCEDGTTPTFDAYYGYFRQVYGIAEAIRRKAATGKNIPDGTEIHEDGSVTLPLVFLASHTSRLNLVPIDWVANSMVRLMGKVSSGTYHLVHPHPPLVRQVIEWSLDCLRIRGVRIVQTSEEKRLLVDQQSAMMRWLQDKVDEVSHDRYLPYVTHEASFQDKNVREALGSEYKNPPPIDLAFLGRLLSYAVDSNWGTVVPVSKHRMKSA